MNIAIILAGGVGKRMGNADLPKQFMSIANKPVIIHTVEKFEESDKIDAIIMACVGDWTDQLQEMIEQYGIRKVRAIVEGGESRQMSIYNCLKKATELFSLDSIVLIHDGVRPFIDSDLIDRSIESVIRSGSAVSCVMSTETFTVIDDNRRILDVPARDHSLIAKAPQSFRLGDIYEIHLLAQRDKIFDAIDSCSLMFRYGRRDLSVIMTDYDNIKITTPKDLALAESIFERRHKNGEE